jgi:pyruvate ferredoxin oxidoreductase alpha subunit
VNSALKKAGADVKGSNYIGDLGGRNISASDIEKIYTDIANGADGVRFIGIGGEDNGK